MAYITDEWKDWQYQYTAIPANLISTINDYNTITISPYESLYSEVKLFDTIPISTNIVPKMSLKQSDDKPKSLKPDHIAGYLKKQFNIEL